MLPQETWVGEPNFEFGGDLSASLSVPHCWQRCDNIAAGLVRPRLPTFQPREHHLYGENFGCWWVKTFPINPDLYPILIHTHIYTRGKCQGIRPSRTALHWSLLIKRIHLAPMEWRSTSTNTSIPTTHSYIEATRAEHWTGPEIPSYKILLTWLSHCEPYQLHQLKLACTLSSKDLVSWWQGWLSNRALLDMI